MTDHFCGSCNRIRVTSTGLAKSCLLADTAVDLRPALAGGRDLLRETLVEVIGGKSEKHHFPHACGTFGMSGIGG
jgi:cyclic pyranopterin phosphate synthase